MIKQLFVITSLFLLSGCMENRSQTWESTAQATIDNNASTTMPPSESANETASSNQIGSLSGDFIVRTLRGVDDLATELTMTFNQQTGEVAGFSGCNRFFGKYSTQGNRITFSQMASTKKLCLDNTLNQLENTFLAQLQQIHSFKRQGSTWILLDDSQNHALSISPANDSPAANSQSALSAIYETRTMNTRVTTMFSEKMLACSKGSAIATTPQQQESKNLSTNEIQTIKQHINGLPLNKLSQLVAPSSDRHVDGAAYATLTIKANGQTYKTPDFDHGNPPPIIKPLVNYLLELSPCQSLAGSFQPY